MTLDEKLSEDVKKQIAELDESIGTHFKRRLVIRSPTWWWLNSKQVPDLPATPDDLFEDEDPVEPVEGEEFKPEVDEYPTMAGGIR
jgi:hypothetical protein